MTRKNHNWSNFGDGIQVYDVVFEVDKLDSYRRTDGKESEKYQKQHEKAVKLVGLYNAEHSGVGLNLSKCRAIIQGSRHFTDTTFFNDGKQVAGNRGEELGNVSK